MSEESKKRASSSIRDRLLALSKERGETFDLTLSRYALERFLFRVSRSGHRDGLILKGAMLFQVWSGTPHRATRDLDLLASGEATPESIEARVRDICSVEVEEDGLLIDLDGLTVRPIREESRYGGVRAKFSARLGSARIPVQIDFGVGDAVTPAPIEAEYPTLLGMPVPVVWAYPRETVVAEKLEAIVDLGMDNSRMKDYFDLWFIATTFQDEPETLAKAVRRTFERRRRPLPQEVPIGLSDAFCEDASKQTQWRAFQGRTVGGTLSLEEVVRIVRTFAMPLFVPTQHLTSSSVEQ